MTGLISIIWNNVHDCWLTRNGAKHGTDAASKEIARQEEAKREITHLYGLRQQMLPSDRELLYNSPEEHFVRDPTSRGMRQWINTWKHVVLRGVNMSKKRGLQGQGGRTQNIRNYMSNG